MSYRRPSAQLEWPNGWHALAEKVRVRMMSGNRHGLWIGPDGRAWIRNADDRRGVEWFPESWLVGVYGSATPQNVIEDDIIERMREVCAMRVAA